MASQSKRPEAKIDASATGGGRQPVSPDVTTRQVHYLIAPRPAVGLGPMGAAGNIMNYLESADDVEVVRKIAPRNVLGAFGGASGPTPSIMVARMDAAKGEILRREAPLHGVIVETDSALTYGPMKPLFATGAPQLAADRTDIQIEVVGSDGRLLENATVTVFGLGFPSTGQTNDRGLVTLSVFGGSVGTAAAIRVTPASDFWDTFIYHPTLVAGQTNTLRIRALNDPTMGAPYQQFPGQKMAGWGFRAMGLDQIDTSYKGKGVKIGLIDSGADTGHPLLGGITQGVDLTNDRNPATWRNDTVMHGSHCAGVIAAADSVAHGIRGIAPEAEMHVFKVFPGGRFSDLIDALDLCIERKIDVVNLSLGSDEFKETVDLKIQEARQNGVACVVAAGNSGGPVQFPACLPSVLTVAAIGRNGEFPADSYHARNAGTSAGYDNMFLARFSCFGPRIDVCAPGVAVISSIPGGGYAAWDGTSMATPHVTGLAALLLAHNPTFTQGPYSNRSEQRVEALFNLIKMSCHAMPGLNALQVGAGLPRATSLPLFARQANGNTAACTPGSIGTMSSQILVQDLLARLAGGSVGNGFGAPLGPSMFPFIDPRIQQAALLSMLNQLRPNGWM